ncbi:VOC family protein [Microlunatus sp. Gsoil 973]|uniref:VOC family protein n=1 Tax=Microlunatus sp. Gsoil 973 TaxID=2672569 RepID=UPI0018A8515C|nr:VOC family protein [Microlunatus sp. Gsoil 973]
MRLTFDGIVVFVADVRTSARVYEEALGLVREWADDDHVQFRLPTKGHPGGAWLLLHPATEQSAPGQYLGNFVVDDVDAAVSRLRTFGFKVTQEPADAPWGVREASVSDADGNGMTLAAPLAAPQSGN